VISIDSSLPEAVKLVSISGGFVSTLVVSPVTSPTPCDVV
jgi:hypothetical protein